MSQNDQMATVPDDGPLPIRKQKFEEAHFDITAMIDLVFMMNIFFLVTSIASSIADLDLPPAKHVIAATVDKAIIVSIVSTGDGKPPLVKLDNGGEEITLPEGSEQDAKLEEAIEAGFKSGKTVLLIKAERDILHRDVAHVAAKAAPHEGLKINLAVLEFDAGQ